MKNFSRRDFLKFGVAGAAGLATVLNFPMLGRRLTLASPGSNFFTIAVISDTQNYVDVTHAQPFNESIFISQTKYLADYMNDLKLAFVTHVGDVVQHGDGTNGEPGDNSYGASAEWITAIPPYIHSSMLPTPLKQHPRLQFRQRTPVTKAAFGGVSADCTLDGLLFSGLCLR